MLAEAGAHDVADAGIFRARAAELELVEFHALLVDAQNADMAGMMMAAGIDAAGNLDLELADIVLAVEIGEALWRCSARWEWSAHWRDRNNPGRGRR